VLLDLGLDGPEGADLALLVLEQACELAAVAEGLRLALTTLTVLPVRGPATLDRRTAGRP
jgi:hypothetical protein